MTGSDKRSRLATSVQYLRPAFQSCDERSQAATSIQNLQPAFKGLQLPFRGYDQLPQAVAVLQVMQPAFTTSGQHSGLATSVQRSWAAVSFQDEWTTFKTCNLRSRACAQHSQALTSVRDLRPAFICGDRCLGHAAAFTSYGQQSGLAASIQDWRPAYMTSGRLSQAANGDQD